MDRIRRVNEIVKRELGDLFERMICANLDGLVTITAVDTAPDLRNAHVYVSVYGSDDQKREAMALIRRTRKELQSLMSKHVKLKYTPRLHFELDDGPEKADRVMRLLDELEKGDDSNDDA